MTKKLKAATVVLAALLVAAPMYAGSAVVGSVAGSLNATLGGQALVPNTVIFSGDSLQVNDGAAVIALENGNRMAFGRETEASFLRESNEVEVVLGRGDVSMYQADQRTGLKVKAGDYEVSPAGNLRCCQFWSPWATVEYSLRNISESMEELTASATSFWVGQMSRRKTGLPDLSLPRGCFSKSWPMWPARA